jgi:enamine deaminase RidA (YjgF/YER057c/UK114 family)
MTTNTTTAEDRLARLGIHLPDAPTPFGAYVPAVQTGNLLFLSGMLATAGHAPTAVGIVGKDLDVKAAREAA